MIEENSTSEQVSYFNENLFCTNTNTPANTTSIDIPEKSLKDAEFYGVHKVDVAHLQSVFTPAVSYEAAMQLLGLSCLIYFYGGERFVFVNDETISEFIKRSEISQLNVPALDQQLLSDWADIDPTARVLRYLSDPSTDVQACITINDKAQRICVVFRGTESLLDLVTNLRFWKVSVDGFPAAKVHAGFNAQLSTVYLDICSELRVACAKYPNHRIYSSGHSLGGALATLFAFRFANESWVQKSAIRMVSVSFGAPRVGNQGWREACEATKNLLHVRVTHNRDCVTAVPNLLYKHVGHNIRIKQNSVSYHNPTDPKAFKLLDFSLFKRYNPWDHSRERYVNNFKKHFNELEKTFSSLTFPSVGEFFPAGDGMLV